MKKIVLVSIGLTVSAILLSIILALVNPLARMELSNTDADGAPDIGAPSVSESAAPSAYKDGRTKVRVLMGSEIRELTMQEYLIGVVAAEMPALFEQEALRAQAVTARTYVLYHMITGNPRHPDADVCTDYTCCEAFCDEAQLRENWGASYDTYIAKIAGAVAATDGLYLSYEDQPILAVFHSSSAGMTESAVNVWNSSVPYLISVASPESADDVPNFVSTVSIAFSDFTETASKAHPDMVFSGDRSSWITDITYTISGRIAALTLGGERIPGTELRAIFGLRSTAASVEITGDGVVFTTAGYGHGVGMSQYGANAYAKQGKRFDEILSLYYPGTLLMRSAGSEDL